MTERDLVACSLAPPSRRRTSAFRELLTADADGCPGPITVSLEAFLTGLTPGGERPRDLAVRLRAEADMAIARAQEAGLQLVAWSDLRYPARLRTIPDPPPALWVRGDVAALGAPRAVAIVGSRAASSYGLSVARQLGHDLAQADVLVVSGLARGCDGCAHRGALEAGGRTVAVVGCGADVVYPPEHAGLQDEVAASGAVVSELPPGAPPLPIHFPLRNRIISGLVAAVVIVEASTRSGSLITAACALEQGREVMAVPGNVLSDRHTGCHDLLRDGAGLVQSARDVLDALGWGGCAAPAGRPSHAPADKVSAGPSGPHESGVLALLTPGEALDLDELAARSGRKSGDLLAELTRLELAGAVVRAPGGRFVRSRR
ncbi:MAG TPA: DNA-processing protein DprA [Vicinamibacterales bacterium]|nr:DNA-processing protein DprA [Vicinamibacterales bacterium]